MGLLLGFAFLSGLVTILAPCIWPLLPIVLASSATGKGHKRPLGITLGIMLSFTVFTLAISYLVKFFGLDPNLLRLFAVFVLVLLGFSMIIPALSHLLELGVSRLSGQLGRTGQSQHNDFASGFVTGLSLGVVWSPCAGPILASIAALAATGQVSFSVILVTLAYVAGVGVPLFILSYSGQKLLSKTRVVSQYTGRIQQIFGVIMLLTALAIYTNYDRVLQLKLLTLFPSYSQVLTGFENTSTVQKQLDALKGRKSTANVATSELFNAHTPAPEFRSISHWFNTDKPLVMSELRGKVVLIDFWTYTCINCIRTLPFVTSWYNKYKDLGFVVIGVHTPEFAFEKDTNNVLKAIKAYGIHYPVAQDNDYGTWDNFSNQYWPAEYLIDAKGIIRRTHFGEGEYDQMEMAIQALLRENGKIIKDTSLNTTQDQTPHIQLSPETYLGARRMQYYYPGGGLDVGEKTFTLSDSLPEDSFSLGGVWNITDENAVTGKNAVLNYHFSADKVFLVLRPGKNMPEGGAKVTVLLDGKAVDASNAGVDAENGVITIDTDRLYNLIDLKGKPGSHVLRLEFQDAGVEVFAFTFG